MVGSYEGYVWPKRTKALRSFDTSGYVKLAATQRDIHEDQNPQHELRINLNFRMIMRELKILRPAPAGSDSGNTTKRPVRIVRPVTGTWYILHINQRARC